jgi:hypothetical protein
MDDGKTKFGHRDIQKMTTPENELHNFRDDIYKV